MCEQCSYKATMNNRPVHSIPLNYDTKHPPVPACLPFCFDCGKPAARLIVEADGTVWFWCGLCDIGG